MNTPTHRARRQGAALSGPSVWIALTVAALTPLVPVVPSLVPAASAASAASAAVAADTITTTATDVCDDAPSDVFRDVPATNRHLDSIDCVAAHGIVRGVGGGNYAPRRDVRRGQMASFLVRLVETAADEQRTPPASVSFGDIAGTTHENTIGIAWDLGIAKGIDQRTFAPYRAVTRGQMASFVARAIEVAGGALPDDAPDVFGDDDGSTHEANIDRIVAAGIVQGFEDGRYRPNRHVTRDQMGTFLANTVRLLADQGVWDAPPLTTPDPDAAPEATVISVQQVSVEHDDELHVIWNTPVDVVGTAAELSVAEATGEATGEPGAQVAGAASVSTAADDTLLVVLDGGLDTDGTYWLQVEDGLVENADGVANDAQSFAFVFNAVDGGSLPSIGDVEVAGSPVTDGGTVTVDSGTVAVTGQATAGEPDSTIALVQYRALGSSWTAAEPVDGTFEAASEAFQLELDGLSLGGNQLEIRGVDADGAMSEVFEADVRLEVPVPSIESVVTDPDDDALVVTFDMDVTCPDTTDARAAWHFAADAMTGATATGSPESVSGPDGSPEQCRLKFPEGSMPDGTHGFLDYVAPAEPSASVTSSDGGTLESASDLIVTSSTRPEMVGVIASSADQNLLIEFSEVVRCSTVLIDDFSVAVEGSVLTAGEFVEVDCDGQGQLTPTLQLQPGVLAPDDAVVVSLVGSISDMSGQNQARVPATVSTAAS